MAVTEAARVPRRSGVLAWALWTLGLLGLVAVAWLDRLVRQAGRPDLALWTPVVAVAPPTGAICSDRGRRIPSTELRVRLLIAPPDWVESTGLLCWPEPVHG
jgi:hypothetical protein